jgi:predicted peptidase
MKSALPIALLLWLSPLVSLPTAEAAAAGRKTPAATASASPQTAHVVERDAKLRLHYLLCLPKDYDQKKAWPLLLFMHGIGERGADLNKVKAHGPPKLIEAGKPFPFVVVSPHCPDNQWWEPVSLSALLDEVVEKYKIDKDRVYVTGLSMGGFGTWSLAAYSPQRFAAIVPICGGGDAAAAKKLVHLPVWAFHGAKDKTVPIALDQKMVDALKQAGGSVKFTVYPNGGHDVWTETYANPKVYEWLLEQKRAGEKK